MDIFLLLAAFGLMALYAVLYAPKTDDGEWP